MIFVFDEYYHQTNKSYNVHKILKLMSINKFSNSYVKSGKIYILNLCNICY